MGHRPRAQDGRRPRFALRPICSAISPTKSLGLIFNASAIANTVSRLGDRSPRSQSDIAVRSRPAANASFSWVNPWRRRACWSASAKARCKVPGRIREATLWSISAAVLGQLSAVPSAVYDLRAVRGNEVLLQADTSASGTDSSRRSSLRHVNGSQTRERISSASRKPPERLRG